MILLLVGLGGTIGTLLRYWIGQITLKTAFPITFLINLLGCLIIGFVVGLLEKKKICFCNIF